MSIRPSPFMSAVRICKPIPMPLRTERESLYVAASLLSARIASVVREYLPHRHRRDGKEVSPVLIALRPGADEPYERFVHERGGLERVRPILTAEDRAGLRAEIVVDQGEQALGRRTITLPDLVEDLRDVVVVAHVSLPLGSFGPRRS